MTFEYILLMGGNGVVGEEFLALNKHWPKPFASNMYDKNKNKNFIYYT